MITHHKDGKTTYSDGDSLSGDFADKIRRGEKDVVQKLEGYAADEDPEQIHSRARALYELAGIHFNGLCGVKRSPEKALELLLKAVELNDDLAQIRLGKFYRDGKQGFKQDGQKALELFVKVAEHGNNEGFQLAAKMFREGSGGFKADGYRAIEFYNKLDELNVKQAALDIAHIYEEGCGKLKANGYKALEIYDDVIRQGRYWAKIHRNFAIESPKFKNYKAALNSAARIYLDGTAGVEPDGYKAIEYLSALAEDDDMRAINEIAKIYRDGRGGVEPEGYKAIELFSKMLQCDEIDKSSVLKNIADIWRKGKGGVTQDGNKAVEYYSRLAESDDSSDFTLYGPKEAFYELGKIYEYGCGSLQPNMQRALEFYKKAAALGNDLAKTELVLRGALS